VPVRIACGWAAEGAVIRRPVHNADVTAQVADSVEHSFFTDPDRWLSWMGLSAECDARPAAPAG
jgi:hypothetical protein